MTGRLAAAVLIAACVGGAVALAGAQDPSPALTTAWTVRPEVPGVAHALVPFGMETTPEGSRAWALGRVGDGTVVLTRAPSGGWTRAGGVFPDTEPVGGATAPQHAGEMTADGHGAVLLAARGQAAVQARLFTRAPGASFEEATPPGAALLAGERLVAEPLAANARALLAAGGGDEATAGAFVVPTDADGKAGAVLHAGRNGWTREAIDAPGADPLRPVAIAVASPEQAWVLARAGPAADGGDRLVLLHRVADTTPRWVPVDIPPTALSGGPPHPAGVTRVTVAAGPADPLTATTDGLWIDLRITVGDTVLDATEHVEVTQPAPVGPAVELKADARWCDAGIAVCERRLGFALTTGEAPGYRSLAFPATAERRYGQRFIGAPVDADVAADAPRRAAQRQGGFAVLAADDRFVLADGIGEDGSSTTQAIAFDGEGTGLTGGGGAFGATTDQPAPPAVAPAPIPAGYSAITAGALSPSGDGRMLTLSRYGDLQLFQPGEGWSYPASGLQLPSPEARGYVPLRAIAWPRADLQIGVGSGGGLVVDRNDPKPFGAGTVPPTPGESFDELPLTATLMDVDCTSTDPLECTAVGLDGLVVRGDGRRWAVERLPGRGASADITSVRYAARTALLATGAGLFTGESGRWAADPAITTPVRVVDGLADGAAVVDGRWTRDGASAAWRATPSPLDRHPVAIAAFREDGRVRTLVATTAKPVALPAPLTPDEQIRLDPSPAGSVVLRETDAGWVDLDRSSFQASGGRDLPASTPETRAFAVDETGTGWMLGGPSSDDPPQGAPAIYPAATAGWLSDGIPDAHPDTPASAPSTTLPRETPPAEGAVRLAVGGHPACLDRCSAAEGQGVTPDVHLRAAVDRVSVLRAGGAGPAAMVIGGGRASLGGEPLDLSGARRYRTLLQGAAVPTYVLTGPGDLPGGGEEAFGQAFATFAAPQGSGAVPEGIDALSAPQPPAPPAGRARRAFAFDVRGAAGVVRVAGIDNAGGSLEGGLGGPQARWLEDLLDVSREDGIPVIVVGSLPLDDDAGARPAADADGEIELLAGRASAYVATAGIDDPADPFFGGAMAQSQVQPQGAAAPLPLLQSATLGYAATLASADPEMNYEEDSPLFTRTAAAALLLLDVDVRARAPETNVAPVTPLIEPLVDQPRFDVTASIPRGQAQWVWTTGVDHAQQRFVWKTEDGVAQAASGPTFQQIPSGACKLYSTGCADAIETDVEFTSSDRAVGFFVKTILRDRGPEVETDGGGAPVEDVRSPIFCPRTNGATTLTLRVAGQVYQRTVVVRDIAIAAPPGTSRRSQPAPAARGTCSFWSAELVTNPAPAAPEAAPEPPPAPPVAPAPSSPGPAPVPDPPSAPQPATGTTPVVPPAAAPPAPFAEPTGDPTGPLGSPPIKAPAPAPPAPPPGLSQAPAPAPAQAAHVAQVTQAAEQRRKREALQSTDQAAVGYRHPVAPLPWEVGGGAALLLMAGAGWTVGRRRRDPALAYARRR